MSEKYYVVSESESVAVREAAYSEGMADADVKHVSNYFATRIEAEAACRARPVEEFGIRATENGPSTLWEEVKR